MYKPLKPITVLSRYEVEDDAIEEVRYSGFLTGEYQAMYVDHDFGGLYFVAVEPTDDPDVYLHYHADIAIIEYDAEDIGEDEKIISALIERLHEMSGYDFMKEVVLRIKSEVDYEGLIVPGLISTSSEFRKL